MVLVVAHVVAVVGARALVRALGLGERIAVLGALLWALGPGVLVAGARVDGTTVGLALLLWSLAAAVQGSLAPSAVRRVPWTVAAVGLAAAVAVTDLATAWALVGLTGLLGVATIGVAAPPVPGSQVRRAWWPVAAGVLVVTVAWSVLPPGRAVLGDLAAVGAQHHRAWGTGGLEVGLAVLAGLLGLGLAASGAYRLRGRLRETGPRLGLAVAALFPVSLLGLLAGPTSTLAAVVWPFLAVGLAPFVAAGALGLWDLGARRTRSAAPDRSVGATLRHVQRDTRTTAIARPGPARPDASGATGPPRTARPGDRRRPRRSVTGGCRCRWRPRSPSSPSSSCCSGRPWRRPPRPPTRSGRRSPPGRCRPPRRWPSPSS